MIYKNFMYCFWLRGLLLCLLFELIYCSCRFPRKLLRNGQFIYAEVKDAKKEVAPDLYVLQFRCFAGYSRVGPNFIQCIDGQWTNEVPICKKLECPDPPMVENAMFEIRSPFSWSLNIGTLVTYTCREGFEFLDVTASNLMCVFLPEVNQAVWGGNVPVCQEKKNCSDPGVSNHGKRQGKCCIAGDTLYYSCLEGYQMVGSTEITCRSSGQWSSPRPLCKPPEVHCELPPAIPHGIVIGMKDGDYFLSDDEAEILCEPGYKYAGSEQYVLCEDGEWTAEFGECVAIFCEAPEPPANGIIPELLETNLTTFPYNFEITYGCDEGYRLLGGDSWRFCGKNGWTGTTPYCSEIRCLDPGVPEHGQREGSSFRIGEKVRFKCFSGYDLLGSVERYCMPNGQWTGELARCDSPSNFCPNPGIPINGFKSGTSYDIGDTVKFRCHPGYIQTGSEVRECLRDRTWSGIETECLGPYDFDNSAKISEILKLRVSQRFDKNQEEREKYQKAAFLYGKALSLSFQEKLILHFAFDVSGSVGKHYFQRSIEFAKAIVKKVGISEHGSRAGAITFSTKPQVEFYPMQLQTTEQVLHELDKIKYTGGGTSTSTALSFIKEVIGLEDNYFLDKKNKKDVVFIITDGKVNMGGNPEVEAKILKDGGVDIYCIGITGDPKVETLYKIASTSKYGEKERPNVFVLQNSTTMLHLVQQIINGTSDYSQCGFGMENIINENRGRIVGGESSDQPWPWMAGLFSHSSRRGNRKLEKAKLICGGSIIHKEFILTAAHCLYEENLEKQTIRLRDKSEITVKLGMVNIGNLTAVQDFGIKAFHINENFKSGIGENRSFDYDIALLQLDRPLEYVSNIRPICLPPKELPKESPLYRPNEFSWVTGWGHADVVNPEEIFVSWTMSLNLKQLRLPIQSKETCIKSMDNQKLNKTLFTERMFCAGDGKRGGDTCKGDSGGPLMQSQMNSDGYIYWTQVGIVSWGKGCGMENTYGFYTHLQSLRSWIDNKINGLASA